MEDSDLAKEWHLWTHFYRCPDGSSVSHKNNTWKNPLTEQWFAILVQTCTFPDGSPPRGRGIVVGTGSTEKEAVLCAIPLWEGLKQELVKCESNFETKH